MRGHRHFHRHIDDDEQIIDIIHKHWVVGIKHLFLPLFSFACCWVLFVFIPYTLFYLVCAAGAMLSLVWGLRNFYDYYLDAWIITDQGIIDVEWHGWFHRQSTRVLYSDIQGVSYEIQGVLGTLLRFGAISVEKISTGSVISMENVKHPRGVEAMILKLMEKYLTTKNLSDSKHVQEILSQIIAREVNLEQFEDEEEYDEEEYDEDDYDEDDYDDEDDD